MLTRVLHPDPPPANPFLFYRLEMGLHEPVFLTLKRDLATGAVAFSQAYARQAPGAVYENATGG
ncbi:MAG: hypothetical protein HY075_09285, partial [Deltaproteobacteria bacterium]|nr:hypothetical protein [Deltaproteobacteria bacterium]